MQLTAFFGRFRFATALGLILLFAHPACTLSAQDPAVKDPTVKDTTSENVIPTRLAPLPFAVTSFGAARVGDAIYVYGGHTGDAHAYDDHSQSNKLMKLNVSEADANWHEVATGERLQGLGMVAHGQRLIMLGGFTAANKKGEKQDLHSQSRVRGLDTMNNTWFELPALPEPRSSHDAAILGDTIYVVGGWNLDGAKDTVWHTTAWSLDLSATNPQWREIAKLPFARRALAAVSHRNRLFAIGGMNEKGSPIKSVAIYDPSINAWTDAPELIGEKSMAGFGASGWSIDGSLIVTTYEGDILQWNDDARNWKPRGKTNDSRFFHRLLPLSRDQLVAIGGASMNSGKFLDIEIIGIR